MKYSRKTLIFLTLILVAATSLFVFDADQDKQSPGSISTKEFVSMTLTEQMSLFDKWSRESGFSEIENFLYERVYAETDFTSHSLAHKLGEIAINQKGLEGFSLCSPKEQYGCYHGAAIEVIQNRGLSDSVINNIDSVCQESSPDPGECIHGLGHALVVLNNYDIPKSYKKCDTFLDDQGLREKCYNGVSMENTTHLTGNQYEKYTLSEESTYPCNELDAKYQKECIKYYIGVLIKERGLSFDGALEHCSTYGSRDIIKNCVFSVGIIEVQKQGGVKLSNNEMVDICEKTSPHETSCLFGVVNWLSWIDHTDRSKEMCKKIPPSSSFRGRCESGLSIKS